MAITDTQKVDYLWKKVGYGRAKTDVNSVKGATNESISSPLFTRGQNVWSQADLIPGVMPATSAGVVTVYPTTAPVECIADTTATSNRTWKTQSIDWIPPEVGPTYLIKVYAHTSGQAGSAAASGTTLSAAETNEEWFFDYASGTLNFIGTNLPAEVAGNSIYISGAVYSGIKGVAVPGAGATFTTLGISSLATFTDTTDNVLGDSNTGAVQIDGGLGVDLNVTVGAGLSVIGDATFDSNISLGQTETVTISGPENIIIDPHPVGVGTTSGNVYIQGDLYVQGRNFQVDSTTVNIADKVIGIATTCTDDILLDGAGLGIGTDGNRKTLLYHNASTSLKSSENFNVASGKVYQIDQTERLSADTLSLGTGTTIHSPASNTLILGTNDEERARIISDGKIGIATTTPESLLDINGTLRVAGISTFNALVDINDGGQANTFKVEDLTNDRVVIAGTGGELEDDGNFTFTGTELTVGSATTGTVIGTDGTVNVSGISTFEDRVIFDSTNSIQVPVGTEAQKDPIGVAVTGQIRFNTTNSTFEGYGAGGEWGSLGGVKDVDGDTFILAEDYPASDDDRLVFYTSGSSRVAIDSTGNVGIGTTTNISADLDVVGQTELDDLNVSGIATFANAQDNTLGDADTGAVQIDGGLGVNKNVTVGGGLSVTGDSFFVGMVTFASGADGNITIGNTNTDNVVFNADIDSNFIPDDDDTYDLGSSTKEWQDLYIDGTANIDSLAADTAAIGDLTNDRVVIAGTNGELEDDGNFTFTGTELTVGSATTGTVIRTDGTVNISGITTFTNTQNNTLGDVDTGAVQIDGGLGISSNVTVGGGLSVTGDSYFVGMVTFASGADGNITIGNSAGDNVVFNADIDSNLIPDDDNTYDLGSSTQQWKDLYINGTANIDSLSADTAAIGDLTDNRVVISGPSGELEDDGNFTFTGTELTVGSATTGTVIRTDGTLNVSGISTFGNRVGIGTTAPQASIHIYRQDTVQGQETHADFILENPGKGNARIFLKTRDNNRDWEFFADDNDGAFGIHDGEANRRVFTISTSSYIGIGTLFNQNNQPRQQLDVAGGAHISGDVGIGVTVPTSKLHVDGTAYVTGISTFNIDVDVTESLTAKQVTADYYGEQHKDSVNIVVTSSNSKTANHRYTGVGDNRSFLFDGDEAPYIQFVPGKTYRFNQADSSNTNHRLKFYLESDRTTEYTTGVTHNGTPGSTNAYTQIVVTKQTPSVLYYQSENHDRIGNEVSIVNSFSLLEHNLGIGTVNPLQALQVGTSENPFVVTSVGNVGIATTNPTADLDVVGLTELDNLNVSGISTLNILGVTGITTTQDFKVVGLSTFNDDINVSFGDTTSAIGIGTTTFTPVENNIVDIRGNVNIEGVLIVGGTNVGDEITAIGASLTNIRTGDLLVTGIATFGSASTIDVKNGIGITGGDVSIGTAGTGFYYDDSTAKVGIGTTAPEYKLEVHGDVHVTGFTTTARLTVGTGSSEYTFPDYDGIENTFLRTDGDGNVDWYVNTTIRTTFNTTAGAGQTTFTTNYTPGLIDVFLNGVKLSSSDYTATDGLNVYLNAGAYVGDQVEIVKFNNDHVSSRPILDYWRGSELNNDIFNVTDNVGIGTSVPTQLLDVAGDVRVRGGLYDVSNASGNIQQVPVADGNGGWVWSAPPVIGVSTAGGSLTNVQYHNAAGLIDGSSEFVFDYSSNEVGIGTTNPSTKLDVRGGTRLGNLSVSSAGVVTAVSGVVTYYGDGSNLTLLDGSNIASGTISSERLSGTYDISITGSIAGTNVDTTNLTVSNSAQFGPAGSGTTFVKIDNAGNLNVSGIGTISTLQLGITTVGVSSILDEDNMVSDSDTALATQQSIKAYVDTEIDALSLTVKDDQTGSALTVDLSSETLIIEGTTNEIETTLTELGGSSTDKKIKVGLPNDVTVANIVTANAGFANTMTYSNTLIGVGNTTDQIILHSDLAVNTYRSVEYSIQITQGSNFHFTKLLALHDGSNAYLTEYGTVFNTSNLVTFDVDVAGGAIRLLATAGIGSTANYVVNFTTLLVVKFTT